MGKDLVSRLGKGIAKAGRSLAVTAALAAGAVGFNYSPKQASAAIVPLNSVADFANFVGQSAGSVNYNSTLNSNNQPINSDGTSDVLNKALAIAYKPVEGGVAMIGALGNNPSNPRVPIDSMVGYINRENSSFYGLLTGETLDSVNGGFILVYDKGGDGLNVWIDTSDGSFNAPDEYVSFASALNMDAFPSSTTGKSIEQIVIPEPATMGLLALGGSLIGLNARRKRNQAC